MYTYTYIYIYIYVKREKGWLGSSQPRFPDSHLVPASSWSDTAIGGGPDKNNTQTEPNRNEHFSENTEPKRIEPNQFLPAIRTNAVPVSSWSGPAMGGVMKSDPPAN